ncbi:MAG: hypothetical protein IJ681_06985 [Bacteroidales bacterium]|nr:hypothetical protein [Bacteroidales bacterium]
MKRIKFLKLSTTVFLCSCIFPLIFTSCDTGECFDNNNYKSAQINKAAPGSQPIIEEDC